MPTAPLPACLEPRCPYRATPDGRGRCELHRKSEAERGYGRAHRLDRRVNRPGARCWRCGSTTNLQRGHRVPVSLGGPEIPSNKEWECAPCHSAFGLKSSSVVA